MEDKKSQNSSQNMIYSRIIEKMRQQFKPTILELTDCSEEHRGHKYWHESGGSHFHLRMCSEAFANLSRLERQKAVNRALVEEFADGMHALSLQLYAPGELADKASDSAMP